MMSCNKLLNTLLTLFLCFISMYVICTNWWDSVIFHQAAELHVGRLQKELGECTMRKEALETMLAQKELQLLDVQEQHVPVRAERNGLKRELQHLKALHSSTLTEAQEQTHRMMVS